MNKKYYYLFECPVCGSMRDLRTYGAKEAVCCGTNSRALTYATKNELRIFSCKELKRLLKSRYKNYLNFHEPWEMKPLKVNRKNLNLLNKRKI